MTKTLIATAAALSLLAGIACAAPNDQTGVSAAATVSSLGIGGEVGYRFNDTFGVRAKAQGFSFDGNGRSDDLRYDYDIKLFTAGGVADYYPLQGGLRLSAGAYYNDNHVDAHNTGRSFTRVSGVPVPVPDNSVSGRADYNSVAPYLGLGYTGNLGYGIQLGFDLGVLYQGSANVDIQRNNPLVPQGDVDEVRRDVKDAMDDLRFYPVVGLNLGYHF